jgi:hypothetical protein
MVLEASAEMRCDRRNAASVSRHRHDLVGGRTETSWGRIAR